MKILVTGSRGFVGKETVKLLEKEGHKVIHFDLMDGWDIRNRLDLESLVSSWHPNRILHLAAIARFAEADNDPKLAFETNVLGTKNVAEVANRFKIPVVYSSTGSAIMPLNDYEPPFNEKIPARGNSVYGCTKAVGEKYIQEINSYWIILRYAHLYGAEKRYHGLIGGFLDRIKRGMKPELYGGLQTNSFVYVKDIARANFLALTASPDAQRQIYNIGSNEELSAEKAGNIVCKEFCYKGGIIKKTQRTVDPSRFQFDISKAKAMLGWEPKYDFVSGIKDMKKELRSLK